MLAGVSTRRYRRTREPVGEEVEVRARSTSKSSVSRTFIERTRRALRDLAHTFYEQACRDRGSRCGR